MIHGLSVCTAFTVSIYLICFFIALTVITAFAGFVVISDRAAVIVRVAESPFALGRGAALTLTAVGVPIVMGGGAALTLAAKGPVS